MTTETSTDSLTTSIRLTDVAAVKVAALLAQEGRDDLMLRVAVQPGGCSGLRYQLYFDDRNQGAMPSTNSARSRLLLTK